MGLISTLSYPFTLVFVMKVNLDVGQPDATIEQLWHVDYALCLPRHKPTLSVDITFSLVSEVAGSRILS